MTAANAEQIRAAIEAWIDPDTGLALADIGRVGPIEIDDARIRVVVELGFACASQHSRLHDGLNETVSEMYAGHTVEIQVCQQIQAHPRAKKLPGL